MNDWHAKPHVELDATLDKWLMLDAPSPDAQPLAPVPSEVMGKFPDLGPELQSFIRTHHSKQFHAAFPNGVTEQLRLI